MRRPFISIIIPLYIIDERFFGNLEKFRRLNYSQFEILVVCDQKIKLPKQPNLKLILTGKTRTGPAEKRDLAIQIAKGELCAFIDDDAYPHQDWLRNAVSHFGDKQIAAVGGPGLTPPEDNFWEQITGLICLSPLCGGPTQHRFKKAKATLVEDYPAYNLIIKKEVLKQVGGYGSYFYGGEDTFLCLKIIKAGFKILYNPEVMVYHHRRRLLWPYLKQISNIGKHRGYFAKKFPQTSRRLFYFFPSIATLLFVFLLIFSLFSTVVGQLFLGFLLAGFITAFLSLSAKASFLRKLLAVLGIFLTHLTYGVAFLQGLLTKKIVR